MIIIQLESNNLKKNDKKDLFKIKWTVQIENNQYNKNWTTFEIWITSLSIYSWLHVSYLMVK